MISGPRLSYMIIQFHRIIHFSLQTLYESVSGNFTATNITGTLTGNVSGNAGGSAATLTTARNFTIGSTDHSFDGSANIDISYANLTNKLTVGDGGLTQNNLTNTLITKLDNSLELSVVLSATHDKFPEPSVFKR